ncbi:MAG: hypothetical protein HY900_36930 [Deltaproteobacteria bacterium]|nr:hypothetical protein [Deltaproteobacteria bacterium]
MPTFAPLSKICRPKIRTVVARERLFRRLDERAERPVAWVHGPGGSGKSTLVASYLDARGSPCLWYQVDQRDADPASLFYYLSLAARQARPDGLEPLPLLTPEYQLGTGAFARSFFEQFFRQLPPSSQVVFDDCHEVGEAPGFHETLLEGLLGTPEGMRVILISRAAPPSALVRLRARRKMDVIGWDDLRLTRDETEAIVQLHDGRPPGAEAIDSLHERTQGWVAGLVLLMEAGRGDHSAVDPIRAERTPAEVFDFFAWEAFNKMDGPVQDFLLRTALLPTLSADMAAELTGHADASRLLAGLSRNNYFTERRSDAEDSYRYHPLFREFLLRRGEATYSPEELAAAKREASRILLEHGHVEEAASLAVECSDWDRLAGLIAENAQLFVSQGRSETVRRWVEHMPPRLLERLPYLLFWLGVCNMARDFSEARRCFERAHALFERYEDAAGLYLTWSGIVDSILYEWSDFSRFDRWIERLDALMERYAGFPLPEIEGRVAGSMFGALMFHLPQDRRIDLWAERVLALTKASTDPTHRIMAGNQLALYHLWWTADHSKLDLVMDLLRPPDEGAGLPPLARIIWTCLRGLREWALGFCAEGQETFEEALHIANQSGVHVWDFMLYFQGIVSYLGAGDYRMGRKYLEELVARIDRTQHLNLVHYHYVAAWQAALVGETDRAVAHVGAAADAVEHLGGPFSRATVQAALAQVQYLCGRREEASASLDSAIELTREIRASVLLYRDLMVKAYFALDSGDEAACLDTLREALPIGRAGRYMNFSWWMAPLMTRLCVKALEAGIEADYVRDLIRRRNLVPDEPPLHLEDWPWPLRIRTLGGFVLEVDGEPLEFSGKVQKKPLELLRMIVALGGSEASEARITEALWPDAEGDTARQSFKVALHRLRQLIRHERAVVFREGRLSLDPRVVWVDVWALERGLRRLGAVREHEGADGNGSKAQALAEKALALYRGPFLKGDEDNPWAVSLRERLRGRFLRLVEQLSERWERAGDWQRAADCCRRGLEADDLAEGLYRRLMLCHQKAGHPAEALRVYERCRRVLLGATGLEPSAETRELFGRLSASVAAPSQRTR